MPETAKLTGTEEEFVGLAGWSRRITLPPDLSNADETVCSWLIYAPNAHPLWTFHNLYVVRLREVPGLPPPALRFPAATHELGVLALNPEHQPYTTEKVLELSKAHGLPYLTPHDVCEQFQMSDDEAKLLAAYAARACAHYVLTPDEDFRAQWRVSLTKTLAHIRGEEHEP